MLRHLELACLWLAIVAGVYCTDRWLFRRAQPRPTTARACRGQGPLQVTSMSARDDEVLVRLDRAGAPPPLATGFVVCRTTGAFEQRLLARWQRRRTLVWLQQDATDDVVVFAGRRRVVVELWTESRAA